MKLCVALAIATMVSATTTARAEVAPAKTLADGCAVSAAIEDGSAAQRYGVSQLGENMLLAGLCIGYVEGIIGGHSAGAYGSPGNRKFCLPAEVTTNQIARVLAKRMENHPELEHLERLPFVISTLAITWPCPSA